jgi:hypothetical protein
MAKRDNTNLPAKVKLREYYLDRYFAGNKEIYVLDACAGDSLIWSELRKRYPVKVMSVDVKKKPGRIAIKSERIMAAASGVQVCDIDTWGSPWSKYFALLESLKSLKLAVFLTIGITVYGGMQKVFAERVAPQFEGIRLPIGFHRALQEALWKDAIAEAYRFGYGVQDCRFIELGNVKYIGFVLTQTQAKPILTAEGKQV